jgi:hypothetical protein
MLRILYSAGTKLHIQQLLRVVLFRIIMASTEIMKRRLIYPRAFYKLNVVCSLLVMAFLVVCVLLSVVWVNHMVHSVV